MSPHASPWFSYYSALLYPMLVAAALLVAAVVESWRTPASRRLRLFVHSAAVLLLAGLALGISGLLMTLDQETTEKTQRKISLRPLRTSASSASLR